MRRLRRYDGAVRRTGLTIVGFLMLAALPIRAEYRIEVVGGGSYRSRARPVDRGSTLVFSDLTGTLVSIKKTDVRAIHEEKPAPKKAPPDVRKWRLSPHPVGGETPQAGSRSDEPRSSPVIAPRPEDIQGQAPPSAADQIEVGRAIAAPSSGTVQVGVPTPMYQPPPPPPPPPPPSA
jgi:hypothetical protein